jgi:hypothetical protein
MTFTSSRDQLYSRADTFLAAHRGGDARARPYQTGVGCSQDPRAAASSLTNPAAWRRHLALRLARKSPCSGVTYPAPP